MLKDKLLVAYNLDEVADSLEDAVQFLRLHNINFAEIRTINGKNIANLSFEETKILKRVMNANNLSISAIASPLFKWYPSSTQLKKRVGKHSFGMNVFFSRQEKKEMIERIIKQACILETKNIRIFSALKTDVAEKTMPSEESELLKYALHVAFQNNVHLLIENEPACYISRFNDYVGILSSGEYPGLRAWFDVANVYNEGEAITHSKISTIAPYIDYIHLKDPIKPRVNKCKPLGQGYIDYENVFNILEQNIFNSAYVSIETHSIDNKFKYSEESLSYLYEILNLR